VRPTLHVFVRPLPRAVLGMRGAERVDLQRATARELRARAAAARGLAGAELQQAPDGRPLPHLGHWWSVSHGGAFAAAAVHRAEVGVDVEPRLERSPEVLQRVVREGERALLPEVGALTQAWTAKEAVLKATQLGLSGLRRTALVGRWRPPGEDFPDGLVLELDGVRWHVAQRPLPAPFAGALDAVLAVTAPGVWRPQLELLPELHSAP